MRKYRLKFHVNHLQSRQVVSNVMPYFLSETKSSAEQTLYEMSSLIFLEKQTKNVICFNFDGILMVVWSTWRHFLYFNEEIRLTCHVSFLFSRWPTWNVKPISNKKNKKNTMLSAAVVNATLIHCRLNVLPHLYIGAFWFWFYICQAMWSRYSKRKNRWTICEQWRPRSDATFCSIWSRSTLFANYLFGVSRLQWVKG